MARTPLVKTIKFWRKSSRIFFHWKQWRITLVIKQPSNNYKHWKNDLDLHHLIILADEEPDSEMPSEKISYASGKNPAPSDEVKCSNGGFEVGARRAASVAVDDHGGDDDDGHKGADDAHGLKRKRKMLKSAWKFKIRF